MKIKINQKRVKKLIHSRLEIIKEITTEKEEKLGIEKTRDKKTKMKKNCHEKDGRRRNMWKTGVKCKRREICKCSEVIIIKKINQ